MGHGGFANPPTGTRPVSSGGAGLGLAREGLPLHLHISATAEQGSYASQERVTKGDFGATKMRFGEGEERAARVYYVP